MGKFNIGDKVTWPQQIMYHDRPGLHWVEYKGIILDILDNKYAEVQHENARRRSTVYLGHLTRIDPMHISAASTATQPDDFAETLASHRDPFGVLGSLAEMEDVEASMRWANSLS